MLEHCAGAQVAQLGLDEGAEVAGGAVLDGKDGVEFVVVLNDHARTHLGGGNRHGKDSLQLVAGMGHEVGVTVKYRFCPKTDCSSGASAELNKTIPARGVQVRVGSRMETKKASVKS